MGCEYQYRLYFFQHFSIFDITGKYKNRLRTNSRYFFKVVSFDGSTSVTEFVQSLNKSIAMRDCALSGFSLFTDDPAEQELEHCLKGHLKVRNDLHEL